MKESTSTMVFKVWILVTATVGMILLLGAITIELIEEIKHGKSEIKCNCQCECVIEPEPDVK